MRQIFCLLFTVLLSISTVRAQETPAEAAPRPVNLNQTDKQLENMFAQINGGKATSEQMSEMLQDLPTLQTQLTQSRQLFNADLNSAQKKLDALGAAPAEGAAEPTDIARQRKELTTAVETAKAKIAQADLLTTKIDEINSLVLKIRNRRLLNSILVKQSSIFHPAEFWRSLTGFADFVFELVKSPFTWYAQLSSARQTIVNNNIIGVLASMLAALLTAWLLGRYIRRRFGYGADIERPDYSQKVRATAWMFVARGAIPAAIIGAFLLWISNIELISSDAFGLLLRTAALYLLYYYLTKALIKASLIPENDKWRIIALDDAKAKTVSRTLIISAAAICVVSFFQTLAQQMEYNADIIYSLKIFANAVKAFCIIWIARKTLYSGKTLSEDELKADAPITGLDTASKISLGLSLVVVIAFLLSLAGYIRLSEYILNRIIVSALVIGILYVIDNLLRGLFHRLLLLRFWVSVLRINRRRLVKAEFWFGLLLTPLMWLLGILVLLAVWGVSVDLMLTRIRRFLVGFNIGGVHVSITSIALGIICFFALLAFFRMFKDSFVNGRLSKIEMDAGLRNSLVSSIGFLGFIVSALLAIAIMGGSLSSITIIAGALSFGVGLGLQNMVSNLAAGMTILWDRSLKIGDWVIINGQEGIVRQINMRSTELETWDKSTVIIPNSDILSKSFINYTYSGRGGRVSVSLKTAYQADVTLIKQTLLEIAASNPEVLNTPAPSVTFSGLGDTSMEFVLNCYTGNVFRRSGIADDLRTKIISRFRELGVKIPA